MVDKWRGHTIIVTDDGTWIYEDTKRLVAEEPDRSCGHCCLPNRDDEHDACLGVIAGAVSACCGHGGSVSAYVLYSEAAFAVRG